MYKDYHYYYVYKIEFEDGYYYYGFHASNSKIDHHYICSSKSVLEKIDKEIYFKRKIIAYYDTFEEATQAEQDIIKEHINDLYCMNKHYARLPHNKRKSQKEFLDDFFKKQYNNIIR